jgi:hypothetical protein
MGRNQALDHIGNVVAAALAGLIGTIRGNGAIFQLAAFMCVGGIVATCLIRDSDIDHELARGCGDGHVETSADQVAGLKTLLNDRRILIYCRGKQWRPSGPGDRIGILTMRDTQRAPDAMLGASWSARVSALVRKEE